MKLQKEHLLDELGKVKRIKKIRRREKYGLKITHNSIM